MPKILTPIWFYLKSNQHFTHFTLIVFFLHDFIAQLLLPFDLEILFEFGQAHFEISQNILKTPFLSFKEGFMEILIVDTLSHSESRIITHDHISMLENDDKCDKIFCSFN